MDKNQSDREFRKMGLEKDIQHHVRNSLQAITVLMEGIRLECGCESKIHPYMKRIKKQISLLSSYLDSLPGRFRDSGVESDEEE